MSTYRVNAVPWADGWVLHIAGEGVTQVRDLESAEQQVRDYLESLHGGSFANAQFELIVQA